MVLFFTHVLPIHVLIKIIIKKYDTECFFFTASDSNISKILYTFFLPVRLIFSKILTFTLANIQERFYPQTFFLIHTPF